VTDAAELHRLLFPVGERQRHRLRGIGEVAPEAAFLAWQRGVVQGLAAVAEEAGARGPLKDWLLLRDEGVASDLLWGGEPGHPISRRAREAFLSAQGDPGERYSAMMAPELRHRLGEHYTPRSLVDRIVAELDPRPGEVVADPGCGDGRFLVALLARGHDPERLWGADLNPLAVLLARLTVWLAAGRPATPPVRIEWADFVLTPAAAPPVLAEAVGRDLPTASVYIGNPPWVTWRNLSDGYRRAVAASMAGSRLHHTRGWSARVAAGQTDLAHVFVHEAVERVAAHGRLGFVLPRTTFKAPVGPGRLREGSSTSGRRYRFREVWDCGEFPGVRGEAVVGFVEVDRPHRFPVRWRRGGGRAVDAVLSDPADPGSPWHTGGAPLRLPDGRQRWTGLRARGGVNTGGGNRAFHVELLGTDGAVAAIRCADGTTAEVEAAYLRPLLRGRDLTGWRADPSGHIVLPHDPVDLRKPILEAELARIAPRTYAYLLQRKDLLAGRRELARWGGVTWYALFRIGPYTAGCWRVVWPHSAGRRLRAAVLGPGDPTIPDQKVVLVPFQEPEPARFLCALLNSPRVARAAADSGGMDASPNLVRRLVLPRYDPADPAHREIVALAAAGDPLAGERAVGLFSGLDSGQEHQDQGGGGE
jgi:SAM-dependent methyltransferase